MRRSEFFRAVRRLMLLCSLLSAGCAAGPVKLSLRAPRVYVQAPAGKPTPVIVTRLKSGGYWYVDYDLLGMGGFAPQSPLFAHPVREEGRFPDHGFALYDANAFLLEDRPHVAGEEQYLVHTLDRDSGEVTGTQVLRTLSVERLGPGNTERNERAFQAGNSFGHVWSGGSLLFQEYRRLKEEPEPPDPVFSVYDPLTDEVARLHTDAGFPPPSRRGGLQYVFGGADAKVYIVGWHLLSVDLDRIDKVMHDLEDDVFGPHRDRTGEADRRYSAYLDAKPEARRQAELLFWGGALEEGKVLWSQNLGKPESTLSEARELHVVPGTSLLKVSWDYNPAEAFMVRGAAVICGGRLLTGKYQVVRLETGEVVDSGTYDAPGPLAGLNCGCKQGLICWEGPEVVLRDAETFREIARRTVPHPVANVYRSYLGDDVWMFCTFGDGLFLDVFTPGLADHVASERLTPQACLPPLPHMSKGARETISWFSAIPGGAVPWFGVRKVGAHFVVGPWSPGNPFSSHPSARGWFFLEVTAEGKFSGTSLVFFPDGEKVPTDSVVSLMVDGSRIWLVDHSSLTLIDWEGTREKGR